MRTPIRALLEVLRSEGVDRVFGNPGTTELPLVDALVEEPDLPYVLGARRDASAASPRAKNAFSTAVWGGTARCGLRPGRS
jgi:thiamine pyrophosphate-dependent acetolactate synthase large subunit-like protein